MGHVSEIEGLWLTHGEIDRSVLWGQADYSTVPKYRSKGMSAWGNNNLHLATVEALNKRRELSNDPVLQRVIDQALIARAMRRKLAQLNNRSGLNVAIAYVLELIREKSLRTTLYRHNANALLPSSYPPFNLRLDQAIPSQLKDLLAVSQHTNVDPPIAATAITKRVNKPQVQTVELCTA